MTFSDSTADDVPTAADEIDALLSEFTTRLQRGETLGIDEFAAQHPNFAEQLKRLLPTAHALVGLVQIPVTARQGLDPMLSTLGDFQLRREIGRGGMGIVYEAEQISLGRRVALKVLPFASVLDSRNLQRFQNEVRAAAVLDHSHIVHVHAVGHDRGVHYYAMQLIEGQTLAELLEQMQGTDSPKPYQANLQDSVAMKGDSHTTLQQAKISTVRPRIDQDYFRRVCRWGIEAADALAHAHEMGIVHRDIKPSNLLINAEGRLWVTDFGLAMTQTAENLTLTGQLVGTLRYMSPEQVTGTRCSIDHRTDIYSLGVTLYELLAMEPAFKGNNRAELLTRISQSQCIPLTSSPLRIPYELTVIVAKAMEHDPAHRYQTAKDLSDDLARYLRNEPIRAHRPTLVQRAQRWARRHVGIVISLVLVLCLFLTVLITGIVIIYRERNAAFAAARETDALRVEAETREADLRLQLNASEINAADVDLSVGDFKRYTNRINSIRSTLPSGVPSPPGLEPEWNHLVRQIEPPAPERVFSGHRGAAFAVAVAPGRKLVASGDAKGQIKIWNLETGQEVASIAAHEGEVRALAFSPDGDRLASGAQFSQRFKLWDATDWRIVLSVEGHEMTITTLDWRPDGGQIASGSRDGKIRLWNATDLSLQQTLEVGSVVNRVQFSADGSMLYSSDKGNSISKWRLNELPPARVELLKTESNPLAFDISSDGRFGITEDTTFFTLDGQRLRTTSKFVNRAAVIAQTGNWAATGGGEGFVDLWRWIDEPFREVSQQRWTGHGTEGIGGFAATPDGSRLITAGLDGLVKVWHIADFVHPTLQWLVVHQSIVRDLVFSPDDRLLAIASSDGRIRVYETHNGRLLDTLQLSDQDWRGPALGFSSDNQTLFVRNATPLSGIVVWQPGSKIPQRVIPAPESHSMIASADGAMLALNLTGARGIALWDTATQQPLRTLPGDPSENWIYSELSLDNRLLVAKTIKEARDGVYGIVLLDIQSGSQRKLTGKYAFADPPRFVHDGRRIAVISDAAQLQLIDVATANVITSFDLGFNSRKLGGASFSPDGEVVAFGSNESAVRIQLLHINTRRKLLTLRPYQFGVENVLFSHGGRILACVVSEADNDGNAGIFLWRFDPPRAPRPVPRSSEATPR